MTSEQQDPREAVLLEWWRATEKYLLAGGDIPAMPREVLRALDAADPLRAMLREVVEALERAENVGWLSDDGRFVEGSPPNDGRYWRALVFRDSIQPIHARIRTLTPTGDTDGR